MNSYVNILNSDNEVICKMIFPMGEKDAKIKLEGPFADYLKEFLKEGVWCRDPESGEMRKMTMEDGARLMTSLRTGLSGSRVRATRCYFDDEPLTEDEADEGDNYDREKEALEGMQQAGAQVEKSNIEKAVMAGVPNGAACSTVGMLQLHWRMGRPVHADFRLSVSEGAEISGDHLSGNVEWPIQWVLVPKVADAVFHLNDHMVSFMKPTEDAVSESGEAQEFVGTKEVRKDSLLMERAPNPIIAPFMPGGSQETPDMQYKQDEHLTEKKCQMGNSKCKNCGRCSFVKAVQKASKVVWLNDEALSLVALFKWEPGEQTDNRREYVIHDCSIPELNGRYAFEKMGTDFWKFGRA
jgi:hypothetical protein